MTRQKLTIGVVAAAFTLSLAPAWAGQAGSRPNTGETTGSASPRGESSSGSSPSGGSSGGGSSSGSTASGSSAGSSGSSDFSSTPDRRERAPQTRERAVPRGSAGSGGSGSTRGTSASAGAGANDQGGERRAVPTYSRPRDGNYPVGYATERRGPVPGTGGGGNYTPIYYDPYYYGYYDPSYSRYRYGYSPYWAPGYGFGLGYFSYDPFLFGGYAYDPYYYQGGYGGGGSGYPGGSSGYGASPYRGTGALRLKVKPGNAQVLVDGYFVGEIDNFDGSFQKLAIEAGAHKVEVRAEGYEPVQFDVMVAPGETITYKGELKRIR